MKRLIAAALLLATAAVQADTVRVIAANGTTGFYTVCFPIVDVDGVVFETNLTNATANLTFELLADNQSAASVIEFAGAADVETIATIGTWVSPTNNTDIRFGECDNAGNFEGMYQIQFHNDHMSVTNATEMSMKISDGGTLIMDTWIHFFQNPLQSSDVQTASETGWRNVAPVFFGTATSGSTTTVVDTANLTQADDTWNTHYRIRVNFTVPEERCIINFTNSTNTATVYPAFNTAVTAEEYEIFADPYCKVSP